MNKKFLVAFIPFIIFFSFWILQVISGIKVVINGTTNPYADPLYSWIFWNMVASGNTQHPYVWFYLVYGFQYSGAHPLQTWELMAMIFGVEAPVLIAFGLYIKRVYQEDWKS